MSSATLKRALDLALELPESERAALAHDLLASLDGPPDADAQQAWEAEITKRFDELETGKVRERPPIAALTADAVVLGSIAQYA
jgi:putative addiction module component (TIGR02574 family)